MENVELHQFCNIKHGFAFKGEYISNNPTKYILLTPGNFKIGGGFKKDKLKYYNGEIPKDYVLKGNDLIVSMTDLSKNGDTLGYSALVPDSEEVTYLHNQRIGLVEITNEKLYSGFLYWLLRSYEYQRYIVGCASGSTVKHTSPTSILSYKFNLPSIGDQKKIASILSSLDDKIELNTRMNEVLEEIARALFHRWFVEFEFPNAEGKPYKSAGGKMVESEMGSVPEGWRVGTIGEIVKITSGKRPPRKESELSPECNIPILGASSVMGYTSDVLYNEPILVTGRVGTHGIIQKSNTPCWPSDNTLVITSRWYEFAYQELLLVDYKNMNRGSTQPLITQGDLKKILIILPSETNMNLFESMMSGIASQINLNIDQSGVLSNLRDNLLPKLVSGEIEI